MKRVSVTTLLYLALVCSSVSFNPVQVLAAGPQTDLSIAILAPDAPVIAGTSAQYQVTTTNQSSGQAVAVVTTLTLPTGITFVSVAPLSECNQSSNVVTCTRATLDQNQSMTFTVNTTVAPDARGTLLVGGATRNSIEDPVQNNNNRVVSTVVQPEIDLQLALVDVQPVAAIAGAPLTYQLRVSNGGRSTATNAVVQLNLPANTIDRLLSSSADTECTAVSDGFSCMLGTVAPVGTTKSGWLTSGTAITITVQPKASLLPSDVLLAGASVDGEELEANTANNFVYQVSQVDRLADLGLEVGDVVPQMSSGNVLTYTFTARNAGPSNHDAVVFRAVLPATVFDVEDVTGTNCTLAAGTVACTLGTLAVGQEATIVVRGRTHTLTPAALDLAAEVRGSDAEPLSGITNTVARTTQITPHIVYLPVTMQ